MTLKKKFKSWNLTLFVEGPRGIIESMHYIRATYNRKATVIVYVEDIIITIDDHTEIEALKKKTKVEFQVKELGELKYFLRMEVTWCKKGIFISQLKYVLNFLVKIDKLGCKPMKSSLKPNSRWRPWKMTL